MSDEKKKVDPQEVRRLATIAQEEKKNVFSNVIKSERKKQKGQVRLKVIIYTFDDFLELDSLAVTQELRFERQADMILEFTRNKILHTVKYTYQLTNLKVTGEVAGEVIKPKEKS